MKQAPYINPHVYQRGDAFIEAMVGVVLMSVVGLGLSYATSRAVLSQRYLNTQNAVISQLRESLVSNTASLSNMCSGGNGPTIQLAGSVTATSLQCQNAAITVGVGAGQASGNGEGSVGTGGQSGLTATLPAGAVVTSLTVATPANGVTAALVGGDGKIAVSL